MPLIDRFLNKSEEVVFQELSAIARDNRLRVFTKPRVADVIRIERDEMPPRHFSFHLKSHFDFLLTRADFSPFMVVEFDGPSHENQLQIERDTIKNRLCRDAGLPIIRIGANHVHRKYRGMSALRWIIEVHGLEEAFYDAQQKGHIPSDEPFDPAMVASDGSGRSWPYWLAVNETQRIHRFHRENSFKCFHWIGLRGADNVGRTRRIEYIRFDDAVVYAVTSFRTQDAPIPMFDLEGEISTCELGLKLQAFLRGAAKPIAWSRFAAALERRREEWGLSLSHGMGPIEDLNYFSQHPL